MKKLLLICCLIVAGCGEPNQMKYKLGDVVILKANNRRGVVSDIDYNTYIVDYGDDIGEIHWERVQEYEIQGLSEVESNE